MKYQSFELPIDASVIVPLQPIPFPSSMHFLNSYMVHAMFFPMDSNTLDYLGASVNGGAVIDQRSVSSCLVSLFANGNDFKFDRLPLSYFANSGVNGAGTIGFGQRPAASMTWPEINQRIDWKASYLEFTQVPLSNQNILFCVKYG